MNGVLPGMSPHASTVGLSRNHSDMKKNTALVLLVVILLGGFFMREYRLFDLPLFGDEVDDGDIALDILHGHLAVFYPQGDGREPLYQYTMAPFFAVLGDSVAANRWPSVAWSMAFVALMYVYGRVLFSSRRVGVLASGVTAFLWWPVAFAHSGMRMLTVPIITVPAVLGLWVGMNAPSDRRALWACIAGGIFAGLASYTYTPGRGFPVVIALFLAYLAVARRDLLRRRWRVFAVYGALTILVNVPLYLYFYLHPASDVRTLSLYGTSWLSTGDIGVGIRQVAAALGMFTVSGDTNWLWTVPGQPVFIGAVGWLFYIGVLMCFWRWRKPEYAIQLITMVVMLVPTIVTERPPNWPRSMGILPSMLVMTILPLEWGWGKIASLARGKWAAAVPTYGALVGILGVALFERTANDMFNVWMNDPGIYWMSYAFYNETADYINRSPDSTPLDFNMDWYVPWRKTNLQRPVQRKDVPLRWTVNNAFVFPDDPRGLRVAFQILEDPARPLQFTFLDLDRPIYVDPRIDPQGQRPLRIYEIPRARLDEHLARAGDNSVFMPGTNVPVRGGVQVGDLLQFLGYEILNPAVRPGDEMDVLTYWRVLRRPPDMAVFVHLLDPNQQVVAQYDGFDVVVDDLAPGDIVVQLHALKLPASLPNAEYRLEMGAYTRQALTRIPLNVGGDHVWLQTWRPTVTN